MNGKYDNIQWVVQQNLTNRSDFDALKNACAAIGVQFIGLDIIPFTTQLPEFDKSRHSITYELINTSKYAPDKLLFIRPDDD
eukprot:gene10366-13152_t